jgi:hypothetical protein
MTTAITVLDEGRELRFSFEEMVRYNGGRSPGGVALAYKALEALLPLLADGPVERRALSVRSAFPGPGVRDAFELVTRAVTGGRYVDDPQLAGPETRFVFEISYAGRSYVATLRPDFVPEEFLALLGLDTRSPSQERRLTELKGEVADRLMAARGADAYDVGAG